MTTQIKATCPDCGEVNLTPGDVQLMVCTVQTLSYYAFDCGGCVRQVRKPADDRIVTLLKSGGVRVQRRRSRRRTAPPSATTTCWTSRSRSVTPTTSRTSPGRPASPERPCSRHTPRPVS
jgi:hypothetical protein